MKLGIFNGIAAIVLALMTHLLLGCAGQVQKPEELATVASSPDAYVVDRSAGFTGYQGLLAAHCNEGDEIVNATCQASGGNLIAETAAYGGWECGAQWDDSSIGGRISVHLDCARITVHPTDGTHGCNTCKEEVTQ